MTQFLIDIASWQTTEKRPSDPLNLAKAKAAGFSLVNIKTSQGDWYSYRSWMGEYAEQARNLGMGVCTFHWLDNTASGAAQARIAYDRMKRIGGMAHQCDCEDTTGRPATYAIWRDYVNAMQDLLGRPIVNYTGDWWWQPEGWTGANLTPYLWAAPNSGYLGTYPGDDSRHWHAGYGGWDDYAVLQYAVSPISGAGGGNLSKSAIRDPRVWAALTGGDEDMATADEIWSEPLPRQHEDPAPAGVMLANGFDRLVSTQFDVGKVRSELATLRAEVAQALGRDMVDEDEIIQGVLAGLGTRSAADVAVALVAAGQDPTTLAAELSRLANNTPS